MRSEYTKHHESNTIWYCTLVNRWVLGQGRRLELLIMTPASIDARPLPADLTDAHLEVARAMRETFNQTELLQQPSQIRTNDAVLFRDLKQQMRGTNCQVSYQRFWVRLELARRTMDSLYGLGGSRFACAIAESRRHEISQHETRAEALLG